MVCVRVRGLCVDVREPCKNFCTDRDADWRVDSGGPKEPCIRWGPDPPREMGNIGGLSGSLKNIVSAAVYAAKNQ